MRKLIAFLSSLLSCAGIGIVVLLSLAFNNQWTSVSIPAGAPNIRDFAINLSNGHIGYADRFTGIWINGSQVNTGLPTSSGNVLGFTITWDATHLQFIAGLCAGTAPSFWRTSNEGSSWTQIPLPVSIGTGTCPDFTGIVVTGNGTIVGGIMNGSSGTCGIFYSTDGGQTTNAGSCPGNGTAPAPGGTWSLYWNSTTSVLWLGTEFAGIYFSTDNGATFTPCSPPDQNFNDGSGHVGIRDGDVDGMGSDSTGLMLMAVQGGVWKQVTSTSTCGTNSFTNTYPNSGTSPGRMISADSNNNFYYGHGKWSGDPISLYTSPTGNVSTFVQFSAGIPTLLEAWKIIQNPIDGQLYVYVTNGGTLNNGFIYKTVASSQIKPALSPSSFAHLVPFIRRIGITVAIVLTLLIFGFHFRRAQTYV